MRISIFSIMLIAIALAALTAAGCSRNGQGPGGREAPVVLLSITSNAREDPHAVTMALQLAGHALDDGRQVILFFNVRSVGVPTIEFPEDLAFQDAPIKELLVTLLDRGAEAHVCPHCMHALGVDAAELLAEVQVTDREKLFSKIGPNTVVFTY